MIRAVIYLLAAGLIWAGEGVLFSSFFAFNLAQEIAAGVFYAMLYALAVVLLVRTAGGDDGISGLSRWRYLSLAPMVAVVLGSFASLPVMIAILVVGAAV